MKRRTALHSALALPLAFIASPSQADNLRKLGRNLMTMHRKVIRGEPKNSATAPAGSYARTNSDGLLFLTNGFGFQYQIPPDSYIEWHLDKSNSQMKFKCVNTDQYRVKAFPCAVIGTMGGRYETLGNPGLVAGLENEFRMKGDGLQSPIFDLAATKKLCGFPCFLSDMPQTDITVKTSYVGNPTVNTFLDMYLHDVDTAQTISHPSLLGKLDAMNSNRTKAYNINVWFKRPDQTNGNNNRPDRGWSGGKIIGRANVSGHDFHVYLKIETNSGNYFRYIALVPVADTIEALNISQVMDWAQKGLRPMLEASQEARQMMAKPDPRGFKLPRWPDQRMVLSGLHMGNEIWWSDPSGQEGVVNWETLRIDVDGFGTYGWGEKKTASSTGQSSNKTVTQNNNDGVWEGDIPITVTEPEPVKRKGLFDRLFGN